MSDERERSASRAAENPDAAANAGAPVEEAEASATEVLAAVARAQEESGDPGADETGGSSADDAAVDSNAETSTDQPGASAASENEAAAGSSQYSSDSSVDPEGQAGSAEAVFSDGTDSAAVTDSGDEAARREAAAQVDTQLDIDLSSADLAPRTGPSTSEVAALPTLDSLPSAAADPVLPPERDGEIRISADHPMAALYMQTPMPPDIKGNRGAGVLIAILATLGFALVHAGLIALWLAPSLAPSQFLDGLLEYVMTWSFGASAAAFFLALVLLVLIVGKAGWWAYVLGGFFVGVAVWVGATLGSVVDGNGFGAILYLEPTVIVERFGFTVSSLGAGILAREATVWFGAWIGARGRRVKQRNAVALAEYEEALAEVQSKQSKQNGTASAQSV